MYVKFSELTFEESENHLLIKLLCKYYSYNLLCIFFFVKFILVLRQMHNLHAKN